MSKVISVDFKSKSPYYKVLKSTSEVDDLNSLEQTWKALPEEEKDVHIQLLQLKERMLDRLIESGEIEDHEGDSDFWNLLKVGSKYTLVPVARPTLLFGSKESI